MNSKAGAVYAAVMEEEKDAWRWVCMKILRKEAGCMGKNVKAEEAVKKWLEENGHDYEVRTYVPDEEARNCVRKDKDTISIPAYVEDVEAFMEQFAKSFREINVLTELKKQTAGNR